MSPVAQRTIRINRAPILTLWASVVAEHLGFQRSAAITLGQALAGMSAYAKAVSLGLAQATSEPGPTAERQHTAPPEHVELLGRSIPVARTADGLRALDKGRPGDPVRIERYLAAKFKGRLADARSAMGDLAGAFPPETLNREGFRLYERFRPEVAHGERGWGALGEFDLARLRALRPEG